MLEFTAREHFSGYRSHATLLAAVAVVGLELAVVALVGAPQQRFLLLLVLVPAWAVLFWLLRRRFVSARQAPGRPRPPVEPVRTAKTSPGADSAPCRATLWWHAGAPAGRDARRNRPQGCSAPGG